MLGFDDYDTFKAELLRSHMIRLIKLGLECLGVNSEQLIDEMEISCSNEVMSEYISRLFVKLSLKLSVLF